MNHNYGVREKKKKGGELSKTEYARRLFGSATVILTRLSSKYYCVITASGEKDAILLQASKKRRNWLFSSKGRPEYGARKIFYFPPFDRSAVASVVKEKVNVFFKANNSNKNLAFNGEECNLCVEGGEEESSTNDSIICVDMSVGARNLGLIINVLRRDEWRKRRPKKKVAADENEGRRGSRARCPEQIASVRVENINGIPPVVGLRLHRVGQMLWNRESGPLFFCSFVTSAPKCYHCQLKSVRLGQRNHVFLLHQDEVGPVVI